MRDVLCMCQGGCMRDVMRVQGLQLANVEQVWRSWEGSGGGGFPDR